MRQFGNGGGVKVKAVGHTLAVCDVLGFERKAVVFGGDDAQEGIRESDPLCGVADPFVASAIFGVLEQAVAKRCGFFDNRLGVLRLVRLLLFHTKNPIPPQNKRLKLLGVNGNPDRLCREVDPKAPLPPHRRDALLCGKIILVKEIVEVVRNGGI